MSHPLPSALDRIDEIVSKAAGRPVALFLDFDGVLAPIVPRADDAALAPGMAEALAAAAGRTTLAIVSGRGLDDVRGRVGVEGIAYAGSHGYEILTADGKRIDHEGAARFLPALDRLDRDLQSALSGIAGTVVERKRFAIAVHYRLAADSDIPAIEAAVDAALGREPELMKAGGKKIFELRPREDWHKGKAVLWLLEAAHGVPRGAFPLYIGDDVTDEDAFAAIRDGGVGILVGPPDQPTAARWVLKDPEQARLFLLALAGRLPAANHRS